MPTTKEFNIAIDDPMQRIQYYIDSYVNDTDYKGFEAGLMRNIRLVSAERAPQDPPSATATEWKARAVFDCNVAAELCNPMNNMHGGAVGLLADMTTTMAAAPIATDGWWEFGGVSRTLATTFISPLVLGSTVRVDCKLMSVGRRLVVHQCVMRDKQSGKLLALAEHGKVALSEQGGTTGTAKQKL